MPDRKRRRRLALAAALAAGGVGCAWKATRQRDSEGEAAPVAATSRGRRTLITAGAVTRAGSSWAVHRARRTFADAERREALDLEHQIRTATEVAETLGNLKGAMMKLGQMASFLDQGMPEPVRDALSQLQQDAPPMAPELAAEVVRSELGAGPEELFEQWDPVPIAAASIGQVHRAITSDGRAVAVKVQYPGVDDAIRGDLDNAGLLFGAMKAMFPGLDPKPLVAELKERISEELDYRLEAENQRLFGDYYEDHPFIHVPAVVDELSSARVLTTELATGARFSEVVDWPADQRNLAAETIYRFVFGSLYRLGAFNGDPHPGNYLFEPDGKVTFLDYGLVKRFTEDDMDLFGRMIQAMVMEHDVPKFRRIVEEVGLLKPNPAFTDEQIGDYFGHFYSFVMVDEELEMTQEFASETVARFFDASGEHGEVMKAANVPRSFVIIQRINLGIYAILGELRAVANWRRIAEELWPWTEGPPSTHLGELEAEWRRAKGR
jgi:predicted unusual protein kinase regulating ubiquinone biosynthesis (AarF/ABC1/UbiB family)